MGNNTAAECVILDDFVLFNMRLLWLIAIEVYALFMEISHPKNTGSQKNCNFYFKSGQNPPVCIPPFTI